MNKFQKMLMGFATIALILSFSAFKSNTKRVNYVSYQYHNTTSAGIDQVTAWDNVTNAEPEECSDGSALPCIIEFDRDGTYPDLASYLATNNTATLINASPEIKETKASL